MNGLVSKNVQCPCCWEVFESLIDCSVSEQQYVEDCYVCCRPLIFTVLANDMELISVDVAPE